MDRTHVFKADAMTLRLRQKSGKKDFRFDSNDFKRARQSSTERKAGDEEETRLRLEFSAEAKEVCDRMTTLRAFLVETRSAYMHLCDNIRAGLQVMTDEQRDLIDSESEKLFTFYSHQLIRMRAKWLGNELPRTQRQIHISNILEMLVVYHRSVHNILLQQKQFRAIYDMETYRLVRLDSDKNYVTVRTPDLSKDMGTNILKTIAKTTGRPTENSSGDSEMITDSGYRNSDNNKSDWNHLYNPSKSSQNPFHLQSDGESNEDEESSNDENRLSNKDFECTNDDAMHTNAHPKGKRMSRERHYKSKFFYSDDEDDGDDDNYDSDEDNSRKKLTQDQIQMMESENAQLYNEMQGLTEEVEYIEKHVTDIAKLQNVFTEKVCKISIFILLIIFY